jgi:D-alanyl-D-alanine carboxypeptidase (penicillin-binding protein 5/6)
MALPVLERVERPRRRRRGRRLLVLTLAALVAAAVALVLRYGPQSLRVHPFRHSNAPARQAAPPPAAPVERAPAKPPPRLLAGPPLLSHTFRPGLSAKAAILVDATTGRVLWARNPHERRQIASTTKIMTALLALKKLPPHAVVRVARQVPRVPLVKEGLRAGERVQAWKLFYGLLLYSGNDDALALAIAAAGSRPAFVHEMNAEARRLGLHDSHFAGPSGVVDVDNYSSAWDLAALTRLALHNERFARIVRTRVRRVAWAPPTYSKIYVNKNQLLTKYRGATGVKTGWTTKAGHCLVASAKRGHLSLIAVVLRSGDEYGDARRLLNLGFSTVG